MDRKRERHATNVKEWHDSWTDGVVEFMGMQMTTFWDVFPPSIDTEFYTMVAKQKVRECIDKNGICDFCEMGTGSGPMIIEVSKIHGVSCCGGRYKPACCHAHKN